MDKADTSHPGSWQQKAVEYAHIMSQVKWTPVAGSMPTRGGGWFQKGTEYTGVPYSSVKSVGRYIGFDIFLKTFLAAVENPESVLYNENLAGTVPNAAAYYGKVCSSFTSYAQQCGIWFVSRHYGPSYRQGVSLVDPPSAQTVQVGDIVYTAPPPGGHVEIVTAITKDDAGDVTHVRTEESWPPTTRTTDRSAEEFEAHIAPDRKSLYRVTDLDVWRGPNRAESLRFPNYAEDATPATINRVLLLDRGDWVPYRRNQVVKINVMDRDALGVRSLVIKRDETLIEEVPICGPGVIERTFESCGDYTAHCILADGTPSQACEFSVCDIGFEIAEVEIPFGSDWDIELHSANMDVVITYLFCETDEYAHRTVFLTDEDRRRRRATVPADLIQKAGKWQIWLIGENRYGRLKKRHDVLVVAPPFP